MMKTADTLHTLTALPAPSESLLGETAAVLKASGDSLRLEILRVLQQGAFGVLELAGMFEMRQSGMSHHLKVLTKAGLTNTQREGNQIFYRRPVTTTTFAHTPALLALVDTLFETIDCAPLSEGIQAKIDEVHQQRAELSQEFFSKNAERFKAQQELIADYELYAPPARDFIGSVLKGSGTVMEVGPGNGQFLAEISPLFGQVYALDNAPAMLAQAEKFAREAALTNVTFILGDTSTALKQGLQVDAIVINMVLHHVPNPATLFADCAQLLTQGGILVVTELMHHNQAWAREKCGDVWLGFEPEQLESWAAEAGLEEQDAIHIGLRNGFQVQVRKFCKTQLESTMQL